MNKEYYLYIHTVPKEISNNTYDKYYVGITCNSPEKRWGSNGCNYKNLHFYNAIQKYGWNKIKHEIVLSGLTKEEAEQKEIEYISKLKSNNKEHGYNISSGGDGGNRKEVFPIVQYTLNGEYIKEYESAAEAGRVLGIDRTHITRAAKHKKSAKGYIFRYKQDKSVAPYQRKTQRTVCKFSADGSFLCSYKSIKEASIKERIKIASISKCVIHKNKTAYGFRWEYEDYLLEKGIMYICGI